MSFLFSFLNFLKRGDAKLIRIDLALLGARFVLVMATLVGGYSVYVTTRRQRPR